MGLRDVERSVLHGHLVVDALDLVLLHLLRDRGAQVLRAVHRFVLHLLELDFGGLVVQPKIMVTAGRDLLLVSQDAVDLLKQVEGSVRRAVDDRLVILDSDVDVLAAEELAEVDPVVLLLLELEAVIKLVHLNFVGVVALEDLREDPAVGEITLGVGDLVGEVERLDPDVELAGQCLRNTRNGESNVFSLHIVFLI